MRVTARTTQWTQYKELVAHYRSDAERSASVRAYAAGCIMLGAMLESALLLMSKLLEDRLARKGCAPHGEDGEERLDPAQWTLQEILAVARRAGWLPATAPSLRGFDPVTLISCGLPEPCELAEESTWHREMLHPARFVQYHASVTEEVYESCRDYVADTLLALAEHLEREAAVDEDEEDFKADAQALGHLFQAQWHLLHQNSAHDDLSEADAIIL